MATKKAAAPAKAPAAPAPDPLAKQADELGAIEKELAPFAAKIARREALRKEIRAKAPDTQSLIDGGKFVVELGERGNKTLVEYAALAKKIGLETYAGFATATLEALAEHVAPGILARFVRTEQIGPRSLKVLEKGQIA